MRGYCVDCDRLLFAKYGDGERLCAGCRENREERAQDAERAKVVEPPVGPWQPVMGRIGGIGFRAEERAGALNKGATRMKGTGVFVTEEERQRLVAEHAVSGMFLSGGRPMGDPGKVVDDLNQKYRLGQPSLPINAATGEFVEP